MSHFLTYPSFLALVGKVSKLIFLTNEFAMDKKMYFSITK